MCDITRVTDNISLYFGHVHKGKTKLTRIYTLEHILLTCDVA